jgi:hypothetical protein
MSRRQDRRNSARRTNARAAGDYEVGYGRPPKDHQFKSGQSGNPKGRPKGAQSEATILQGILHERIEVQQAGRPRKMSTLKALLLKCRNAALGGDLKALAFLLSRYRLVEGIGPETNEVLDQDDRQVLEAFVREHEAQLETKKE